MSSTRRVIAAGVAAVVCCAQAAEPPVTVGEPVVVTATRFDDSPGRLPIGVEVIGAEDIARSTAASLPELLGALAGIRTRDLSGSPNLQVDMRGFGIFGDQNTLVLLDGVRVSENEQAPVNWAAIPLSAIERIEIVRGAGAVLYGGGASGGVINIVTRAPRPGERGAALSAGAGSHNARELQLAANLAGHAAGLRLNARRYESDNYRDNNRFELATAQAQARWLGASGALTLKAGADDQRLGLPGALSEAQLALDRRQAATPGDFSTLRGGYLNLGGEIERGAATFAANLGYRVKDTDASFFVGTPFRNSVATGMRVLSFAPRWRLAQRLGGAQASLVLGADYDDWRFDSVAGPAIAGRPHATQRNTAAYLQQSLSLDSATSASLGVRLHRVAYAVGDELNAGAALVRRRTLHAYELAARQRLAQTVSAYAKLGRSFRVPNVNDLYSLFTASVTPLEPQISHDRELGLELGANGTQLRIALYHMDLANEILFDPIAFANRNLPPTRRYGLEAQAKWRLAGGGGAFVNYTYAVSEFRAGQFGGASLAGNEVPLVPRHAANLGLDWRLAPRTRLGLAARYVGRQVYDGDETNTFGRRIPAYTVLDAKLAHEAAGWQLAATVRNLLDERYYTYAVFTGFPTFAALPAPGRSLFVSAQYRFP
ncbi:MAG TPA: TonB-dependent receptor [Burkholderiales bacterium]|nr:TonB-dependent receptor [Burkholderiales bacterium]